jgi:fructokinase
MGHILLPHDLKEDPFPGACPFHKDCFEGLASGFAMEKRWRKKAELIPNDHQAWILEARYIAKALMNYILILAPQKIIIGGGVGNKPELMNLVKKLVLDFLNGYTPSKLVIREMEDYIQPPGLGSDAGVFGAIALAEKIFKESKD